MTKTYSVFDRAGSNVEDRLFDTLEDATAHAHQTNYMDCNGFFPVHVGENCPQHDEHENGNCYHCGTLRTIDKASEIIPPIAIILGLVQVTA